MFTERTVRCSGGGSKLYYFPLRLWPEPVTECPMYPVERKADYTPRMVSMDRIYGTLFTGSDKMGKKEKFAPP